MTRFLEAINRAQPYEHLRSRLTVHIKHHRDEVFEPLQPFPAFLPPAPPFFGRGHRPPLGIQVAHKGRRGEERVETLRVAEVLRLDEVGLGVRGVYPRPGGTGCEETRECRWGGTGDEGGDA